MAPNRIAGRSGKRSGLHPGWLQVELPAAPLGPDPERVDFYLPADDPCLSMLTSRLKDDFPNASDVTFFAGEMDSAGGQFLKFLLRSQGWLLIARYRLESLGVVTDHLVSTGWAANAEVPPEMCWHLTTCSFDRNGSLEVSDAIVDTLMDQARQMSTEHARKRHRKRVRAGTLSLPDRPMSIPDLDRKLDAIERRAIRMRKRIAAIPFKTDEYHRLDRELTGIVQDFHSALKQRRNLRLQRAKERAPGGREEPTATDIREVLEPIVLIRWRLES
jgi:hypothetical protein